MNKKKPRIIITPGEPAGIGPDIIVKIAQRTWPMTLIVCADPKLLTDRALQLNLPLKINYYKSYQYTKTNSATELTVLPINLIEPVIPGKLNIANSSYVLTTLNRACDGCLNGEFNALITGPINKRIINSSGFPFMGHTEYFAKRSNCKQVIMLFVTNKLKIALVTTHLPLNLVSSNISQQLLYNCITILITKLHQQFRIVKPCIYVCGLNPHAGEHGYIGREEIEIINPIINILRSQGHNIVGPLPTDTIFLSKYLKKADVILTMYHDQGLPIIKYLGFNQAINITIGLPFIRTSVDHGTALELAGTGLADSSNMKKVINFTNRMVHINNE